MTWRKSSWSWANGNCVEVAAMRGVVAVRDTQDPAPVLWFTAAAWQVFADSIGWD